MNFQTLVTSLSNKQYVSENAFEVLKGISLYTNNKEKFDKGRELVIRALANKDAFSNYLVILNSLVRTVGLFPYLKDGVEEASPFDLLEYELHRPINMPSDVVFHSMQLMIYHELIAGRNVILSASTSVGKSLIIDSLIASNKFKKIVLVVPTIALIDETRKRITEKFREVVRVITHSSQSTREDMPAIYILTQERVLERDDLHELDLFIIDEFYKLDLSKDDDGRCIQLNLAFYKLFKRSKQFYLIGPNIDNVKGFERLGRPYVFIPSNFKSVAVNIHSFNYSRDDPKKLTKLIELCNTLEDATLIYCQSPKSVNNVASHLLKSGFSNDLEAVIPDAIDWIATQYHSEWTFLQALRMGIGIHHGAIPRALQQYVLKLFNQKKLRFLICTSTIIEGVNTVARNVIVFDRRKNTKLLDYFTYKNIEGRAGRMGQYYVGNVYSLESSPPSETSTVSVLVGNQNSDTPFNFLLQIDNDDLTESSRVRLSEEINTDLISLEAIKQNPSYSPEKLTSLARAIEKDSQQLYPLLNWSGRPKNLQLKAVCGLIFGHLESVGLRQNSVLSGDDLHRHLVILSIDKSYSGYLKARLSQEVKTDEPSEILEKSLKVIRNVFCFSFPRALRALEVIQKSTFEKLSLNSSASYGLYVSEIENLYLAPTFFALDDFGIPLQTAKKLNTYLDGVTDLDELLAIIKSLSQKDLQSFSEFEKEILFDVSNFI